MNLVQLKNSESLGVLSLSSLCQTPCRWPFPGLMIVIRVFRQRKSGGVAVGFVAEERQSSGQRVSGGRRRKAAKDPLADDG